VPEGLHSLAAVLLPWLKWLFRYSLLVAFVQLALGGLAAYYLTESWQRWRQRRDFQATTLAKFSELSYEMMDWVSELLVLRANRPGDLQVTRRREFLSRWTVFVSIRSEVMAYFGMAFVHQKAYQGVFNALNALRGHINSSTAVPQEVFVLDQETYLAYREAVVAQMVHAMGLMSDAELTEEWNACESRLRTVEAKRVEATEKTS
jgi:hypothetical protein